MRWFLLKIKRVIFIKMFLVFGFSLYLSSCGGSISDPLHIELPDISPQATLRLVCDVELDNTAAEPIADRLTSLMESDLKSVVKLNTPGKTIFDISPVSDVESFIEKIDFANAEKIEDRKYALFLSKDRGHRAKINPEYRN